MSHLIFTKNFHQQVRGKLQPGSKCIITYDPLRLIPLTTNYLHGDSAFPITAHVKFDSAEEPLDLLLYSEIGITNAPVIREDGLGSMLTATFTIPEDSKEFTVWFSLRDPAGALKYDSNYGQNFHYRFPREDIKVLKASITSDPKQPQAELEFQLQADAQINSVSIHFRQTNKQKITGTIDLNLEKAAKMNLWTSGIVKVPFGAVIAYEIAYHAGGKEFKLNNNGDYFIMPKQ